MGRRKQANPQKAVDDVNVLRISSSSSSSSSPSTPSAPSPSTSKSSPNPIEWMSKKVDSLKRPNKENVASTGSGSDPLKILETALDLRVKRRRNDASGQMPPPSLPTPPPQSSDVLGRLSSLVTNVGGRPSSFRELNRRVSKQDNEDCSIFTCLQCQERFQSLQQLVTHMEKTKHFFTAAKLAESSKPDLSKEPRGNMRYGTIGYKCSICGFTTKSNIDHHMISVHRFKDHSEWQAVVKLIPHETNGTK